MLIDSIRGYGSNVRKFHLAHPLPLTRVSYAPNSGLSQKDIENIVGKTDVELRAYYVNLPSHLRLPSTIRTSAPAHIYQLQQVQAQIYTNAMTNLDVTACSTMST